MAFLQITNGVTTLTLEVSMQGASEDQPDRIGGATRAFSGKWRSDEQEFRTWKFVLPLYPQADFVTLRGMVKNGTPVTVKGAAVESVGGFSALVRINSAPFVDDGRTGSGGFARDVELSVMAGVAS